MPSTKSELRLGVHSVLPGRQAVIEIWYEGKFVGQVTGADGPGVRVITKHEVAVVCTQAPGDPVVQFATVLIDPATLAKRP